MKDNPIKVRLRDILSVLAGILSGIIVLVLLTFLFFSIGMILWGDGGTKEELDKIELNLLISVILMLTIASLISGLVTALLSFRNNLVLPAITGIILITIAILYAGFDLAFYGFYEIIIFCSVLPLTVIGGWIGNRIMKKRKSGI